MRCSEPDLYLFFFKLVILVIFIFVRNVFEHLISVVWFFSKLGIRLLW